MNILSISHICCISYTTAQSCLSGELPNETLTSISREKILLDSLKKLLIVWFFQYFKKVNVGLVTSYKILWQIPSVIDHDMWLPVRPQWDILKTCTG